MKLRWATALLCLITVLLPAGAMHSNRLSALGSVAAIASQAETVSYGLVGIASKDNYSGRQWALDKIMVPQAWGITSGDSSVVIAVLDTGIDKGHEDLIGKVIAEVNFSDSPTTNDRYGHGTHIAGIIAAIADNNLGIAGLAPGCRLMNVKVADDNGNVDGSVAAKGIVWAVDHGARVINLSLFNLETSTVLEQAVNYAWDRGAIVVAASGNYVGTKLTYPAYYSSCLAVAATDGDDCVVSWSSYGDWVDVAAPGVDIFSTLPANGYGSKSGTSMSAAHVSGLAGLLFAIARDVNGNGFFNDEVRTAIESTCDKLDEGGSKGRINSVCAVNKMLTAR